MYKKEAGENVFERERKGNDPSKDSHCWTNYIQNYAVFGKYWDHWEQNKLL